MKLKTDTIPMLTLEKYLLGELPQVEEKEVEKLLENNPTLQAKLDEMIAENRNFESKFPMNKYIDTTQTKSQSGLWNQNSSTFKFALAGVFAFFCLSFLLPVWRDQTLNKLEPELEVTRLKGMESSLIIYRKNDGDIEQLKNNAKVTENDKLQLAYIAGNAKHGVIFSLDGNRQITLHYPGNNESSTRLTNNGETALAFSYVLDNAPNYERFYFITSDQPLNVSSIMAQAEQLLNDDKSFSSLSNNTTTKLNTIQLNKE